MDEERDEVMAEDAAEEFETAPQEPEAEEAAQAELPARQEEAESLGEEPSSEHDESPQQEADVEVQEAELPQTESALDEQVAEDAEAQAVDATVAPGESDAEIIEAPTVEEAADEIEAEAVEEIAAELEPEAAPQSEEASDQELAGTEDDEETLAEAQVEPEPEPDDGRAWYVVHCYSGYENKVRHNLEQRIESMGMKDQIFDVVVPTEEEIEVKEGKRRTVERRVFPGYILVNMIMGEEPWYVVRNTPGVTSFVGQGNEPLPLRPEEVSQIIKRMEADAPRIKVTFRSGERVRIVDGPFNDFRGTVSEIDMERAKVRVMVNFFGRETPVELDFLQVEKA